MLVLPGALVWVVAARSTALPSRFYAFYTNLHVHVKLLEGIGWRAGQKDTAGAPGGGVHTATTPTAFMPKMVSLCAPRLEARTPTQPPPHHTNLPSKRMEIALMWSGGGWASCSRSVVRPSRVHGTGSDIEMPA